MLESKKEPHLIIVFFVVIIVVIKAANNVWQILVQYYSAVLRGDKIICLFRSCRRNKLSIYWIRKDYPQKQCKTNISIFGQSSNWNRFENKIHLQKCNFTHICKWDKSISNNTKCILAFQTIFNDKQKIHECTRKKVCKNFDISWMEFHINKIELTI